MYYVYIIRSKIRNYTYIGISGDVSRRVLEHNSGKNKTTRAYKPFQLLHVEEYESRQLARNREKYLKGGSGREWIKRNFPK